MTEPRRATVVRRMLPHQGRPVAVCTPSSISSALCTGADVARAWYQPPPPPGLTAETEATAHTGRAERLVQPVGADTRCGTRVPTCRTGGGRSHLPPSRHSITAPGLSLKRGEHRLAAGTPSKPPRACVRDP